MGRLVSTDKVMEGLVCFLDNELMPKLPVKGWQRPVCGTVIAMAHNHIRNLLDQYKTNPMLVGIGIFDENGMVDIDTVKQEFSKQLNAEGMTIEFPLIGGITFHQADVDKLHYYIINA